MLDFIEDNHITIDVSEPWDLKLPLWLDKITDEILDYYKMRSVIDTWNKNEFFFSDVGEKEYASIGKQLLQQYFKTKNIQFEEYRFKINDRDRIAGYVFKVTEELSLLLIKYSED